VKFVQASASTFSTLNSIQLAFLKITPQDPLVNNVATKSDEISSLFQKECHCMHGFGVSIIYLIKHRLLGLE